MKRLALGLALFTITAATPIGEARADALPPPPKQCPEGHTPKTDHLGPYCAPPRPTTCPKEHIPRVRRDRAYCEPPPLEACPEGSRWTSRSATETFCVAGRSCKEDRDCGRGKCAEGKLCIEKKGDFRRGFTEIVHGTCTGPEDCEGEGRECVEAKRCDLVRKRIASSPEAAKPYELPEAAASASPATSTATPSSSASGEEAKPSGGCGSCTLGQSDPAGDGLWLLVVGALWGWRRRGRGRALL